MTTQKKPRKEKQPPILFDKTQAIIGKVNKLLGGTLVTYFNNPRGNVCHDDVLAFYELLEKIGHQKKIYLFIKSSGEMYTRPEVLTYKKKEYKVPSVFLSGNHKEIEKWRGEC